MDVNELIYAVKVVSNSDVSALRYRPEFLKTSPRSFLAPASRSSDLLSQVTPPPITGKLTPVTLNFAFLLNLIRHPAPDKTLK